jgi:protein SCO1/2
MKRTTMNNTPIILAVVLAVLASCGKKDDKKSADLVTFAVRGEVVSVEPARNTVTIAHEEIPNYMMAMTMPFKVKDSTLLADIQPGDSVVGTLAVSRTESWLETLAVSTRGESPRVLSPEDVMLKRLFKEGEPFPDFSFTNQNGRRVSVREFRGKTLAFTLIYTRCPLPDFCIRMSDYFSKIQKRLERESSLNGKWHLMTISFDPEFDTPEVLKKYGQTYNADFATWDFVTDTPATVRKLADGLGLTIEDDEGGLIAHNLRTVIIDPSGNLSKVVVGNEWTPEEIVAHIKSLSK